MRQSRAHGFTRDLLNELLILRVAKTQNELKTSLGREKQIHLRESLLQKGPLMSEIEKILLAPFL